MDACAVDDDDIAVGEQRSVEPRRLTGQHPVKGHRVAPGLNEAHCLLGAGVEAVPLNDQTVRQLVDLG